MSWSASGVIKAIDGNVDFSLLTWAPQEALDDGPQAQADLLMQTLQQAANDQLIDGAYSLSLIGHYPPDEFPLDRKSFTLSLSPVVDNT